MSKFEANAVEDNGKIIDCFTNKMNKNGRNPSDCTALHKT